jgi:hypothetical protein
MQVVRLRREVSMTRVWSRLLLQPSCGRTALIAAAMAPALAACNGTATPVALPVRSPSAATPASPTAAVLSAQQQVMAARTNYTLAIGDAEKSRSAAAARELLRPYLAAGQIDALVQTMSGIWAKGEIFYGQDVLHILRVSVTDNTAFVYDCDDTSSMGLKYAATGQVVPGSGGTPDMNLITRLGLVGGHWLVQFQVVVDEPCTT